MRPHVIQPGEYLTRLAHERGFDADAVWNHSLNRELRERRANHHVLAPGDVIYLPEPAVTWLPLGASTTNRYRAEVPLVTVKVILEVQGKGALANKAFHVFGAGAPRPGTTDKDGRATFAVPAHVTTVTLVLDDTSQAFDLQVGHLDPLDEPSGIAQRLANLGFLADASARGPDAERHLREALTAFQAARGLTVTGEADTDTRRTLSSEHRV